MFGFLLIPNIGIVFADHPPEGGSGCGGDCTPPTLGKDSSGKVHVTGGFTINGQTFDAEYFEQTITTQTILENEPVEIILKVFENGGPQNLKHVGIVIGNEYVFDSYIWRHLPNAEIRWEQEFDGVQSIQVENSENLITDVNVEAKTVGTITTLKFQFTPTMTFDTSHIMVKMWDQNRNPWVNNFHNALEIQSIPIKSVNVDEDIIQTESEIHEERFETHENNHDVYDTKIQEMHCSSGLELIYRTSNGYPTCVTSYSADTLIEYGWAIRAQ